MLIGYYLSPISLRRAIKGAAAREFVSRASGVRRCRVISSIPVDARTGEVQTTWCLCEITGTDFSLLDLDGRFEFLGFSTDLNNAVPPTFDAKLTRFGIDPVVLVGASTIGAALRRIMQLLNPTATRL